MMKRGILAAGIAALLAVGSALPAQAVTTIKRGGSCNLSANWKVNISATWYDGELEYVALNSPGALHVATQFPPLGNSYALAYGPEQRTETFDQQGSAPPWLYRASFYGSNSAHVTVQVYGGSGACYKTLDR